MRKVIYKLFFLVGFTLAFLGLSNHADATPNTNAIQKANFKSIATEGKLYFSDVISQGQNEDLIARHYSHSSHRSHSSHYSHRSSRY